MPGAYLGTWGHTWHRDIQQAHTGTFRTSQTHSETWVHTGYTLRYTQTYGDAHGDTIVYMQAHKALSGTFGHT